ncbi:unnamed protein product [Bursaphelenchus okinawaensis]|uniref:Galactosylgalactosylxylosylprotein 3-beta-glucuronosyltransferase n=1 Tax=Bursaphelenchus okinawaensis TaxID=465554 RepID=A0A811KVN5_9BILA|nr:unnamed protein product [Bursaphelenchus okinawaensis]CAG9114063.1 unnamed protein product [Bursaphelenchus okinawaensis]
MLLRGRALFVLQCFLFTSIKAQDNVTFTTIDVTNSSGINTQFINNLYTTVDVSDEDVTIVENHIERRVILITSTYHRPQRIADFHSLIHNFRHIDNIFWIVVEEGPQTDQFIESLLKRSNVPYVYLNAENVDTPCHGWSQRNAALDYIRSNKESFKDSDVVYFANDENTYDKRLFDKFIRNVQKIGVWAAGAGYVAAESPLVLNDQIIGWNTAWRPKREFALSFSQFAFNIKYITETNAKFDLRCAGLAMEDCFLRQLNIQKSDIQPFGYEGESKPIYVWHRRIDNLGLLNEFETRAKFIDDSVVEPVKCRVLQRNVPLNSMAHAKYIVVLKDSGATRVLEL